MGGAQKHLQKVNTISKKKISTEPHNPGTRTPTKLIQQLLHQVMQLLFFIRTHRNIGEQVLQYAFTECCHITLRSDVQKKVNSINFQISKFSQFRSRPFRKP